MMERMRVGKCYLDKSGAARIYIPAGLVKDLNWNNLDEIILIKKGSSIEVMAQRDYLVEVPQ